MFKAITKKSGVAASAETKGTLTALWSKAGGKQAENRDVAVPDAALPGAQGPTAPPSAAQLTPKASARREPATEAAEESAPLTTGGDVAIGAAAEPSPRMACAAQMATQTAPGAAQQLCGVQPAEGQHAKGGTTEKKRKRSAAAEAWTEEQLAQLRALFDNNQYAKTAAKAALAAELGVELGQVNKWFEKQRKQARAETGTTAKSGRPKAADVTAAAALPGQADAAATAAAPSPGQECAIAAAEAVEEEQEVAAMDVDASERPAAAEQAAGEQDGERHGQDAAHPAAPAADAGQPMAVDAATQHAAGAGPGATPAAAARPAAEPAPAAQQPTPAADAAGGNSPGAAAAAAAKTPGSAAPQRDVSAADRDKIVAELEAEQEQLCQHGLSQPLRPLPTAPPAAHLPFSDAALAAHVAAQRAPLSALVAALLPLFTAPDGEAPVQEAVLRSRMIDLAARKSHGPKHGESPSGARCQGQCLGSPALGRLRPALSTVLPKELRAVAQQAKRRAARVQERLGALGTAVRLLGAHKEGKASAKLAKALDALQRVKTLAQLEEEQQAEREVAAAKQAAKRQQSAAKSGAGGEEKARLKAEKEAAKEADKERQKAEKEAERERLKAEKEAEKERTKAEREVEKERKHKETEVAKLAKKTGFKDAVVLKKTANKFMSFFQPKAGPGGTPGGGAASGSPPVRPARSSSQQLGCSQAGDAGASQQQQGPEGGATGRRERGYHELFLKPEGPHLRNLPPQPSAAEAMDAAAGQPCAVEQVQAAWQQLLAGMKRRRREAAAQPRLLGLPPTWARKSNAAELANRHLDKLQESGADLAAVRTWRRRFLWFPADSNRPPFYGSCTPSPAVHPRCFLGRDEAVDYEVMSDLDWEEEPEEGSSLTGAEEEASEIGGGEEEEEADSFICADGYLSEDEGVRVDDLDGDEMQTDSQPGLPEGAAVAGIDPQRLLSMQQLEAQMERARRAGKPLIVSRLSASGDAGGQPGTGCIQGDRSLLAALAAEVLLHGLRVTVPEDPAAEGAGPATAAKQASTAAGGTAGEPAKPSAGAKRARPDDLLPCLLGMVQAAPRQTKNKLVDAFLEAHQGRRVTKKWVLDGLKEHADWQPATRSWALKPAALQLLEAAAAAGAGPAPDAAPAAEPGPRPPAAEGPAAEAGGVAATPAAVHAAPTAGIERFFAKQPEAATPAVPSALRPSGPPSEMKAPSRLVTTTAAGEGGTAAPPPPLAVPDSVAGTADPFWRCLLLHIESADGGEDEPAFLAAFQPASLARLVGGMPAGVLTALVAGVAAGATPPAVRAAYLRCLAAAAESLAAAEAEAAGDSLSASQQVWQPRGAPPVATLAELCREPQLVGGMAACIDAARHTGGGPAVVRSGREAARLAARLAGSEACRAALAAAEPGGGRVEQLRALGDGAAA